MRCRGEKGNRRAREGGKRRGNQAAGAHSRGWRRVGQSTHQRRCVQTRRGYAGQAQDTKTVDADAARGNETTADGAHDTLLSALRPPRPGECRWDVSTREETGRGLVGVGAGDGRERGAGQKMGCRHRVDASPPGGHVEKSTRSARPPARNSGVRMVGGGAVDGLGQSDRTEGGGCRSLSLTLIHSRAGLAALQARRDGGRAPPRPIGRLCECVCTCIALNFSIHGISTQR